VTDLQALTAAFEANPNNDIIGAMLADELMSERDMTRTEADATVERVRRAVLDAPQLLAAAELLKPGTFTGRLIPSAVRRHQGFARGARPTVIIVPGAAGPVTHRVEASAAADYWSRTTITVGAAWVLNWWDTYRAVCAIDNRARAAARKAGAK